MEDKILSRGTVKAAVKLIARTGGSDLKSWDSVLDSHEALRAALAEAQQEVERLKERIKLRDDRARQCVEYLGVPITNPSGEPFDKLSQSLQVMPTWAELAKERETSRELRGRLEVAERERDHAWGLISLLNPSDIPQLEKDDAALQPPVERQCEPRGTCGGTKRIVESCASLTCALAGRHMPTCVKFFGVPCPDCSASSQEGK